MTHPDITEVQRYGYLKHNVSADKPIGVCLFCGSDVFRDGEEHVKSFDGVFCNRECCQSYYEIDIIE